MPPCSLPAMGCPGSTRRAASAAKSARARWAICCLVLPASVMSVSAERVGAIFSSPARMAPTGTAKKMTSLLCAASARSGSPRSMAPRFCAICRTAGFVAADEASGESVLAQRQSERAADEPGSDDRDLTDGHEQLPQVKGSFDSAFAKAANAPLRMTERKSAHGAPEGVPFQGRAMRRTFTRAFGRWPARSCATGPSAR